MGRQGHHVEAFRVKGHDLKGLGTYGPGGPQDGKAAAVFYIDHSFIINAYLYKHTG